MANQLDFIISMTDRLTRPLAQIQGAVTSFADRSQASFARIGTGVASLWGVAQAIRGALSPAWDMQAALGELDAKGVAKETLDDLTARAMKLSSAFGQNATDIIRSAYSIKGAIYGLTDRELPRVTAAAATLAAGVKASTEEASEYIAMMASRFSRDVDRMGAVDFAENLAGKTAWLVKTFGVEMKTMQALMEGTKNAGADFGVSMEEQFTVLGMLSKTMGTEASGMYEQFLRSAPAAAKKIGISFVDAAGRMLPMATLIDRLQAKFGKNIEGNVKAQQALDAAFGSGADVIKKLWGQQDRLNSSIAELARNDGMNRAREMAEKMADPWDRLVATFHNISAAIGNAIIPVLAPLINRVTDIGNTFTRWMNMFPNIARWIGYITLGILGFGAAGAVTNIVMGVFNFVMTGNKAIMKAVTFSWKAGAKALGWLRTSFIAASLAAKMTGVSVLTVVSPVLLIAAAIAAVVVVVIKFWQPIKAFFTGFIAGFTEATASLAPLKAAFGRIAEALAPVWQGVKTLFGWFSDLLSPVQLTTDGLNSVTSAGQTCGRFVAAAVGLISAPLELLSIGLDNITQMFGVIISGWGRVIDAFDPSRPVESFKNITGVIGDMFGNLWNIIKGSFNRTWNWIAEKLNKIPGISLDLKPTEQVEGMTPEAVRVTAQSAPASPVTPPVDTLIPDTAQRAVRAAPSLPDAQGTSQTAPVTAAPPLAGDRIRAVIPQGGIRSQMKGDSTTNVNNSRTFGDLTINNQSPMTPGQLEEWTELYAG